jgi:hypothetical protein
MATLLNGSVTAIFSPCRGAHEIPTNITYNIPDGAMADYGAHYYQHDLWISHWLTRGFHVPGKVVTNEQIVEERLYKRSTWFNEYLKPLAHI